MGKSETLLLVRRGLLVLIIAFAVLAFKALVFGPTTYHAATSDAAKPVERAPRDTYIIKDGKPALSGTATCTGIGGKQPCDINIKPR